MTNVFAKTFNKPNINEKEIKRYMGVKGEDFSASSLIKECEKETENAFEFKACYAEFKVEIDKNTVNFGPFKTESASLSKFLKDSKTAIIFVATVGFETDRLIKKYSALSPSKALCFSAMGSERIEALCDELCDFLKEKYNASSVLRFSPGYGDLSLEIQKNIFSELNVTKNIGVFLNESLLMSPSKSVSAIVKIN